jgi:hypothetical protein
MLRLAQPTALLVLVAILLAAPSSADRSARQTTAARAWLAYGHDAQLTNFVRMPGLTRNREAPPPGVDEEARRLDHCLAALPERPGRPASIEGAVFVATEGGSLYALAEHGTVPGSERSAPVPRRNVGGGASARPRRST